MVELKGEGKTVTIESKGALGAADGPDPSIVALLQSGHGPAGATGLTRCGGEGDPQGRRSQRGGIVLGSGTGIAGTAAEPMCF